MCFEDNTGRRGVATDHLYETRNERCVVKIVGEREQEHPDGSRITIILAMIVVSFDPRFPIGTEVAYVNEMGHVLCEGSDEDEQDQCLLHPLDAERHINFSGLDDWIVDRIEAQRDEQAQSEDGALRPLRVSKNNPVIEIAADTSLGG